MPLKKMRSAANKLDAARRERDEFEAGFHKSSSGNLTRRWEDFQLTIFRRDGAYSWVISNRETDEAEFSEEQYETREEAMSELADHLNIGLL